MDDFFPPLKRKAAKIEKSIVNRTRYSYMGEMYKGPIGKTTISHFSLNQTVASFQSLKSVSLFKLAVQVWRESKKRKRTLTSSQRLMEWCTLYTKVQTVFPSLVSDDKSWDEFLLLNQAEETRKSLHKRCITQQTKRAREKKKKKKVLYLRVC